MSNLVQISIRRRLQKEIKVYNVHGVCHTLMITPKTTPVDVCSQLTEKVEVTDCYHWSLVEVSESEGIGNSLCSAIVG